jgi:hypothetical protein
METNNSYWTKLELKTYILLLCANADKYQSEEEINLIKSKIDFDTFEKMYKEFCDDTEEVSLEKIEDNIQLHHYTTMELSELRKEMREVFFIDKKFIMMEQKLDQILDNIIY